MKKYLEQRLTGRCFEVEKLLSRGANSSFRITTDRNLEEDLYDPKFWPKGIIVRRFFLRRTSRTSEL